MINWLAQWFPFQFWFFLLLFFISKKENLKTWIHFTEKLQHLKKSPMGTQLRGVCDCDRALSSVPTFRHIGLGWFQCINGYNCTFLWVEPCRILSGKWKQDMTPICHITCWNASGSDLPCLPLTLFTFSLKEKYLKIILAWNYTEAIAFIAPLSWPWCPSKVFHWL